MIRLLSSVFLVMSFTSAAFAQNAGDAAAGEAASGKLCGTCHDVTGKPFTEGPATGPAFFTIAYPSFYDAAKVRDFLSKPHKDVKFTAKDKDDIVAYLTSISQRKQ